MIEFYSFLAERLNLRDLSWAEPRIEIHIPRCLNRGMLFNYQEQSRVAWKLYTHTTTISRIITRKLWKFSQSKSPINDKYIFYFFLSLNTSHNRMQRQQQHQRLPHPPTPHRTYWYCPDLNSLTERNTTNPFPVNAMPQPAHRMMHTRNG